MSKHREEFNRCEKLLHLILTPPACRLLGLKLSTALSIPDKATVTKAYHTLARTMHPDRSNAETTSAMAELNSAKDTLLDADGFPQYIIDTWPLKADWTDDFMPAVKQNVINNSKTVMPYHQVCAEALDFHLKRLQPYVEQEEAEEAATQAEEQAITHHLERVRAFNQERELARKAELERALAIEAMRNAITIEREQNTAAEQKRVLAALQLEKEQVLMERNRIVARTAAAAAAAAAVEQEECKKRKAASVSYSSPMADVLASESSSCPYAASNNSSDSVSAPYAKKRRYADSRKEVHGSNSIVLCAASGPSAPVTRSERYLLNDVAEEKDASEFLSYVTYCYTGKPLDFHRKNVKCAHDAPLEDIFKPKIARMIWNITYRIQKGVIAFELNEGRICTIEERCDIARRATKDINNDRIGHGRVSTLKELYQR